jgi:hypothetical protein
MTRLCCHWTVPFKGQNTVFFSWDRSFIHIFLQEGYDSDAEVCIEQNRYADKYLMYGLEGFIFILFFKFQKDSNGE